MDDRFFEAPILNSPYEYPSQNWELDEQGQPTQQITENRRGAAFITPIPNHRDVGMLQNKNRWLSMKV